MSVEFEVKPAQKSKVAIALLNRPQVLNSLNLQMCQDMSRQFYDWKSDPEVACIFIHGNGEKGLCAGGDVKTVREAIEKAKLNPKEFEYILDFFAYEYFNDLQMYSIQKPIVAWASGITMGGGLGLIRGASFRVATESTVMAMPEIAIGLYPDVGAAHFLNLLPQGLGVFLGTTGARFDGTQAHNLGIATHMIPDRKRGQVLDRLLKAKWTGSALEDKKITADILSSFSESPVHKSDWSRDLDLIKEAGQKTLFHDWQEAILLAASKSPWIKESTDRWKSGSPLSVRLTFEYLNWARKKSLLEIFKADYSLSLQFSLGEEFSEGVRSLLVDKDGSPRWKFPRIDQVPDSEIQSLMKNLFEKENRPSYVEDRFSKLLNDFSLYLPATL